MEHEPECNAYGLPRQRLAWCTCGADPTNAPPESVESAYRRGFRDGYNAHAASVAHWEATHGAYQQQHGQGENP